MMYWKLRFIHGFCSCKYTRKLPLKLFLSSLNKSSCQPNRIRLTESLNCTVYKLIKTSKMNKSPGLFVDIGRKARDLLYKDYAQRPPIHFQFQSLDCCFDLACQVEEIVPGLHTAFRFVIPESAKVELRFLHDYVGITSGIGLKAISNDSKGLDPKLKATRLDDQTVDPIVNFSGVIGGNLFSLGTEVCYDISTREFAEYNAGLSFNSAFLTASLTLNDGDTLKTSYYQAVNPMTRTAIAAELKHRFINNGTTTFTVGGQHALLPSTLVKARMDSDGKVGALIQQDFWTKFYLTAAGEVDFRDMNRLPKIGFSMALRP